MYLHLEASGRLSTNTNGTCASMSLARVFTNNAIFCEWKDTHMGFARSYEFLSIVKREGIVSDVVDQFKLKAFENFLKTIEIDTGSRSGETVPPFECASYKFYTESTVSDPDALLEYEDYDSPLMS